MKNTSFLLVAAALAASFLFFTGCSKNVSTDAEELNDETFEVVGTSNFLSDLNTVKPFLTKSGELTEYEARELLAPVLSSSILYLKENGYDISEDFAPEDPRIVWVATGLAEFDNLYANVTKTSVGGCVLQAIGIAEVLDSAGKKIVKALAKKCLEKAVPYIGAALTAFDFVMCVTE